MKKTDKIAMNIASRELKINKWDRLQNTTGHKFFISFKPQQEDLLVKLANKRKELLAHKDDGYYIANYRGVICEVLDPQDNKEWGKAETRIRSRINDILEPCTCKDCPQHKKVRV